MDNKVKSRLSFINYEVEKVILEKNQMFKSEGKPISISFDIEHNTKIHDNSMRIELIVTIFEKANENNLPFYMQVILDGYFEIEGDNIEVFEMNGIALLFPYIRAIVSTYTANANMPTLVLPPINVANYYKEYKEKNV